MKIIVLNGFDTDNLFEKYLNSWFESKKVLVANLKIRDLELGPCRSCGSCGTRTPGQCVLKDGIEDVMKTVVTADVMILLSPVHFGGYSATLKKVLDRFMLLGLPTYFVKKGHLLHQNRYGKKTFMGLGVMSKDLALETSKAAMENFQKIVEANANNLLYNYSTTFINDQAATETWDQSLNKIFTGVSI